MIELDGAYLEGGGQILRTAVGLSALTGKPFKIVNIRRGRCSPGIKEQHLQAVNAVAELCNAEVKHAELHSEKLEFHPGEIKSGRLNIRISTAGSVGLVLQALLIPAIKTDLKIDIEGGGTFGKWAMPVAFMQHVLLPILKSIGYYTDIKVKREGFYPKGGASVYVDSKIAQLKPFEILEKGRLAELAGVSVASSHLEKQEVAERQAKAAKRKLYEYFKITPRIKVVYSDTLCPGSGIQLWAKTENSVLGGNGLGEPRKRAEAVGKEAAESLIYEYSNGSVDHHAADQLIPYMAIAGRSAIMTSRITNHIKTNAYVTERFLNARFSISNNIIKCQ